MKKDVKKNLIEEEKDIDLMKDIYLRNEFLSDPDISDADFSKADLSETDVNTIEEISKKYSKAKCFKIFLKAAEKAEKEKAK